MIERSNTGVDSAMYLDLFARKQEYLNKRDDSFDFMILGEDDFDNIREDDIFI